MSYRLVIDGNSVYEIDEEFERYREKINGVGKENGKTGAENGRKESREKEGSSPVEGK